MKKLFSSVFIVLILLNVMGYYGLLLGLQYTNAKAMREQFDAGMYAMEETVTVKIPFKTQYLSDSDYERVDGDFERDGEVYRLIKQRLYRDTFRIVCIKDKRGTALNNVIADYVKTFSDLPSEDGQDNDVLPLFIKEYFVRTFSIQPQASGWEQTVRNKYTTEIFIDDFTRSIIHPPERR